MFRNLLPIEMKLAFFIGLGGFAGSMARYGLHMLVHKWWPLSFPYGTLLINIIGCLLIGLILGIAQRETWMSEILKVTLATGFCGGFTTFSAFAYENIKLLQSGQLVSSLFYITCSVVLGVLATLAGLSLVEKFTHTS